MKPPPPRRILELIDAFRRSKVMFAAVSLGIFERLRDAPRTAADLAAEIAVHGEALERLLNGCVSLRLLAKQGDRYRNTLLAEAYLCRNSPTALTGYIQYSNDALFPMWAHLEDAVREGSHRWRQTFGPDVPIFQHFFRTEQAKRDFIGGMHGLGMLSSESVVSAFDLRGFRRLVDLGGATGHRHRRLPALSRFERGGSGSPAVVPLAREHVEQAGLSDRIEVLNGDFFAEPLPAADLYAAGRILHDWAEDKIRLLLAKVFSALPHGGAFLIVEKLLDEDKCGPTPALMQSINMLICTEGRERSRSEYTALLEAAGFSEVLACRTGKLVDAVLARKA